MVNNADDSSASRDRDYFTIQRDMLDLALTLFEWFLCVYSLNGTKLPSHPDKSNAGHRYDNCSLGQGIECCNRAWKNPFYYIVGDGELNEGQCWEAIQFASHQQLSNLIVFVDDNKKQLDGFTKDICNPGDFEKFLSIWI